MKKTQFFPFLFVSLMSLGACNSSETTDSNVPVTTNPPSNSQTPPTEIYDSVYHVQWNENSYTAELIMKEGKNLYVHFEITDESKKIRARIAPNESNTPVHIAQIIYPDGNKYGPFEMMAEIDIKEKGNYQMILSEAKPGKESYNGIIRLEIQKR